MIPLEECKRCKKFKSDVGMGIYCQKTGYTLFYRKMHEAGKILIECEEQPNGISNS